MDSSVITAEFRLYGPVEALNGLPGVSFYQSIAVFTLLSICLIFLSLNAINTSEISRSSPEGDVRTSGRKGFTDFHRNL